MELFPTSWIDRIIGIDSETQKSNVEVVRFLAPLLGESGLKVEEQKVIENGETFINLIAFNQKPDHPDLLLFNTHLDTVSAGNPALWTKTGGQPRKATRVGDKIYGLGSADVKIDFLCKLWAVRCAGKIDRPIALVGTYGEERGLVGVQKLFAERKVTPKYAMVGEPSDLELIYAHKGHVIATIELPLEKGAPVETKHWSGQAAHSSTPGLGINALSKLFRELKAKKKALHSVEAGTNSNRVPESAQGALGAKAGKPTVELLRFVGAVEALVERLGRVRDRRFSPSQCTLSWNLARMEGQKLQLTFDIRTLPGVDASKVKESLLKLAPKGARWVGISVDFPLAGTKGTQLIKAASKALSLCGVKPKLRTKASSTEAAIYHHFGSEAIVFGPGVSINNVHKPNEHCLLSQVKIATRFYRELLTLPWGRA
jgi:acetylornithine deacetylase/succinyl-diaminopimelate desuccinylase-like protein